MQALGACSTCTHTCTRACTHSHPHPHPPIPTPTPTHTNTHPPTHTPSHTLSRAVQVHTPTGKCTQRTWQSAHSVHCASNIHSVHCKHGHGTVRTTHIRWSCTKLWAAAASEQGCTTAYAQCKHERRRVVQQKDDTFVANSMPDASMREGGLCSRKPTRSLHR